MRHRKAGIKLSRTSSHRQAMFRNMVTSLFKHDRIRTTDVKAKELRRWADKMITLAKRGDLHARRQVLAVIREKDVVYKLFNEALERFGTISGGYTRVVKLGRRAGDAAPISMVELVSGKVTPKPTKKEAPAAPLETPSPSEDSGKTPDETPQQTAAATTSETSQGSQAEESPIPAVDETESPPPDAPGDAADPAVESDKPAT